MPKKGRLVRVNLEPAAAAVLAALPHEADRTRILKGLGASAMAQWTKLAQEQLRSTAKDYIAGISHREEGGKVFITLDGRMANMVEQGISAFDMRETLLKGPNVKHGKNGPYATIPFSHGTPGTTGRNVGAAMPTPIHQAASKLLPSLSRPGAPVSRTPSGDLKVHGKRLHPGLPMNQKARDILNNPHLHAPWHKSSIYMGMIRKAAPNAKGKMKTTGYQTFRRISRNSDPRAWQHGGIKAREIAKQVQDYIGSMASSIVATASGK